MTHYPGFAEDLALVVVHTGYAVYRELTDPDDPRFDTGWVESVRRQAGEIRTGRAGTAPDYPGLAAQAGNALGAAARAVSAALIGSPVCVPEAEQARRLAVCHGCDRFDAAQGRCRECGCVGRWKAALATEGCPLDKW